VHGFHVIAAGTVGRSFAAVGPLDVDVIRAGKAARLQHAYAVAAVW
jgi:hypothetical protein